MRELLKEMNERLRYLESQPSTSINEGRIAEILLCIIRIQEMILDGLKAEIRENKIDKII